MGICKVCKFYTKIDAEGIGYCKRYPPVMTVDRAVEVKDTAYWGRPVLDKRDTCGEFQPKEVTGGSLPE